MNRTQRVTLKLRPFQVGDKVRCIKPKSDVNPKFDLSPDRVYTVERIKSFRLVGEDKLSYKASRFVFADD